MKKALVLIVSLWYICNLTAQKVYWTEDELALQRTYIDANTQKLLGNIDKALALYKQVVDVKRNLHPAWYEIARMQHASQDNEASLISINKAIKLDPHNEWYTLFKVDLYEKMDNETDAAATLVHYFETNPPDQNLLERLAYIYTKSSKSMEAIHIYDELQEHYGIHEKYSKKKYNLYTKLALDEKAITEIKNLVTAYPYEIDYMHLLAANLLQKNRDEEAHIIFNRILAIDPDDTKASIAMAQTHRENGNSPQFIKSITGIISDPNLNIDVKIQELIPPLNKMVNRYDPELSDQLVHAAKLLTKAHPQEAKAHAMAADINFHSGKYGEAKIYYQNTLEMNNTIYPVWEQYLYTLSLLNHYNDMVSAIELALDIYPNQGRLYYFDALAHYKLNHSELATSALLQAEVMSRKNPDLKQYIYTLKAIMALDQSDSRAYQEYLHSALEIDPSQSDLLLNSFIEDHHNVLNQEANTYAFNLIKNKNNPPALFSQALIAYQSGDMATAESFINKAIKLTPFAMPKLMDLFMAIKEHQSSVTDLDYVATKQALNTMGYTRIYNYVQP